MPLWGRKGVHVYAQLLELWPMAKFHAEIWSFWKSAPISETITRRAKISSISTPWGRKKVYVQLLALRPMAKFHAQIWQFWKFACISGTAAHRAKIGSIFISIPWNRESVCATSELWPMAMLVFKQSVKAHGPFCSNLEPKQPMKWYLQGLTASGGYILPQVFLYKLSKRCVLGLKIYLRECEFF